MVMIEQLAKAALSGDSLRLRSLYQEMVLEKQKLSECQRPQISDKRLLALAASLIELMAERTQQSPPKWTEEVSTLLEPMYLVPSANSMKRLRVLCETQSPYPLRKRKLYAPPNFLEFA